jgi:hypothetical protein
VTIGQIKVNNAVKSISTSNSTTTLNAGDTGKSLTLTSVGWTNGNPYKVDLYDSSGNAVGSYQANAPGT